MNENKTTSVIVDLNAFRKAKNGEHNSPPVIQEESRQITEPAFYIFHDLLSTKPLTKDNETIAMRNVLMSLNSSFSLAAQSKKLPDNAGMYNAHLSLTNFTFSEETMNEVTKSFAELWREKNPRDYYRFAKLHQGDYIAHNGNELDESIMMHFRRKAVASTPAYQDLKALMSDIFPTANLTPSIINPAFNSFRPCLCIDADLTGPDLRTQIQGYLSSKEVSRPTLRLV